MSCLTVNAAVFISSDVSGKGNSIIRQVVQMGIMGANFPVASALNPAPPATVTPAAPPTATPSIDYSSQAGGDTNSDSFNSCFGNEKNDLEQETKLKIIEILEVCFQSQSE